MQILPLTAFALPMLLLGACSPTAQNAADNASPVPDTAAPASNMAAPVQNQAVEPLAEGSPKVIGLEGLGALQIGQPVPAGSGWAARGAQTGTACTIVSSKDYPGVYAIVKDDTVQRITVGQRSTVKLAEGLGVGASEADVRKWFGGFRSETHKYEDAPAKYLTAPNAANGSSALRFEIGSDGRVRFIHVGMMPVLAYVEGCG